MRFKQSIRPFEVLNQPSQFSKVLQARQRVCLQPEARFLELFYQRSNTLFRLGMVVSKRVAPNAVTRNMVKRQWREAFRSFCVARHNLELGSLAKPQIELSNAVLKPITFDVVLRAKPALKAAYQTAKRDKKLSGLRQQIRVETQALLQQLASLS